MTTVTGLRALEKRLAAIGDTRSMLRALQIATVSEAQARVPRKTGHLQRSIRPGALREDFAIVEVRSPYAKFVEEGTGLFGPRKRRIVPKNGKVMAWPSSRTRLSGRSRTRRGKAIAGMAFATSTKGMKAKPYLIPGAKAAVGKSKGGMKDAIVTRWNRAA
jgi:hypothetical protein